MFSRQALFENSKLHPHMFCLPVLKRDCHRRAILSAIKEDTKGRFFAGTDSAPHCDEAKNAPRFARVFSIHTQPSRFTQTCLTTSLKDISTIVFSQLHCMRDRSRDRPTACTLLDRLYSLPDHLIMPLDKMLCSDQVGKDSQRGPVAYIQMFRTLSSV